MMLDTFRKNDDYDTTERESGMHLHVNTSSPCAMALIPTMITITRADSLQIVKTTVRLAVQRTFTEFTMDRSAET